MKYLIRFFAVVMCCLMLTSCSSSTKEAEFPIKSFMASYKDEEFDALSYFVSSGANPIENVLIPGSIESEAVTKNLEYEILSMNKKGDSVVAEVRMKNLDMYSIMSDVVSDLQEILFIEGLNETNADEIIDELFENAFTNPEIPVTEDTVTLILSDNGEGHEGHWVIEDEYNPQFYDALTGRYFSFLTDYDDLLSLDFDVFDE